MKRTQYTILVSDGGADWRAESIDYDLAVTEHKFPEAVQGIAAAIVRYENRPLPPKTEIFCDCGCEWCNRSLTLAWNGNNVRLEVNGFRSNDPTVAWDWSESELIAHLKAAPPANGRYRGERYIFNNEYPFGREPGFVIKQVDYDQLLELLEGGAY